MPALLRPGRFDRRVVLDRPDVRGREAILKVHVKGKPLAERKARHKLYEDAVEGYRAALSAENLKKLKGFCVK